jgi:putative HAD hydrolase
LNVPLSDTFGFGDGMNDVEMLETVGTAVCMENGSETLKTYADYICPSVTDDGIYKAFEKFGLI